MSWSVGPSHISAGAVASSSAAAASADGRSDATALKHRADSPSETDCSSCSRRRAASGRRGSARAEQRAAAERCGEAQKGPALVM